MRAQTSYTYWPKPLKLLLGKNPKSSKNTKILVWFKQYFIDQIPHKYSRLSLSRNRRDPQKQFEISVLRHIRFVVLRKNNLNNQILQMTM